MQKSPGLVWISEEAFRSMELEAARMYPSETGGVMMGYWADPPREAVVTSVIGPGPRAVHKAESFVPDHEYHAREVEAHYNKSGRLRTYLGDWHTHPNGGSYLSETDRNTLAAIAAFRAARAPIPLMVVLGTIPHEALRVWRYRPSRFGRLRFPGRLEEMDWCVY